MCHWDPFMKGTPVILRRKDKTSEDISRFLLLFVSGGFKYDTW